MHSNQLRCLLLAGMLSLIGCRGRTSDKAAHDPGSGRVSNAANQNQSSDQSSASELRRELEERQQKIMQECEGLGDHPWAGLYRSIDSSVCCSDYWLAPNAGAPLRNSGDQGSGYHFGTVTEKNGKLTIQWRDGFRTGIVGDGEPAIQRQQPNANEEFTELLLVRWGKRRYIIPSWEAPAFCSAVKSGIEPQKTILIVSYLRKGDESNPAEGDLELPEGFEKYLQPIATKVTALGTESVLESHYARKSITIGAGEAEGVMLKMTFQLTDDKAHRTLYHVTAVRNHEADAEACYYLLDPGLPALPVVGAEVTTLVEVRQHLR
jgi:hypothetical protein